MAKNFDQIDIVEAYDQHIRKLIPGYELIHQQIHAILTHEMHPPSHILIVGCGTGQELISLAERFKTCHFTAIDLAQHMLDKVKQKILLAEQHHPNINLSSRIHLHQGDTSILKSLNQQFDVALSILVAHFVEDKISYFQDIQAVLKPNAILLNYDLMKLSDDISGLTLKTLCEFTGLHPKQSQQMLVRLQEDFHTVQLDELKAIFQQVGFTSIRQFCQILNYAGLIAYKSA